MYFYFTEIFIIKHLVFCITQNYIIEYLIFCTKTVFAIKIYGIRSVSKFVVRKSGVNPALSDYAFSSDQQIELKTKFFRYFNLL